jgi:hypothetical protein
MEMVELDDVTYEVEFDHDCDGSTLLSVNGIDREFLSDEFCTELYDSYVESQNPYKR